jgi:hypothetical protein
VVDAIDDDARLADSGTRGDQQLGVLRRAVRGREEGVRAQERTAGTRELNAYLDPTEREKRLYDVASRYYETIMTAIRRYDPDHLILGDRYNGNKGIPSPCCGDGAVRRRALRPLLPGADTRVPHAYARRPGPLAQAGRKPVIIADIGNWTPTELNPHRIGLPSQAGRAEDYGAALEAVLDAGRCRGDEDSSFGGAVGVGDVSGADVRGKWRRPGCRRRSCRAGSRAGYVGRSGRPCAGSRPRPRRKVAMSCKATCPAG